MNNRIERGQSLPKEWSRRELTKRTKVVLSDYAPKAIKILHGMVRRSEGRETLGSVARRAEDEQLVIDTIGENLLTNLLRENSIPAFVLGEHHSYDLSDGNPQIFFAIDPFDNSSQYKRGLDTPPYTVVSAYLPNGEPIAGIVSDIKDRRVYFCIGGKTFLRDLETGEVKEITRSQRTTIKDDGLTLATYLGSNEYSLSFFRDFKGLIQDMPPKGVLYAGGGSYIYGLLAAGAVDAYVMRDEPLSEVYPGLTLALAAGCTVVSVNPDGSFQECRFDPNRYYESISLFIAACTPQIRDEIIGYYLNSLKQ